MANSNINISEKRLKDKLREKESLRLIKKYLLQFIDFFYPPFKRIFPLKTFRYAFCGGSVALLNLVIYAVCNQFLFKDREPVIIGGFEIQYYTLALIISFCLTFPLGFALNKFIVFPESNIKGKIQLIRYASMTAFSIFLNYALSHLLIGIWQFWPTPSYAFITVFLAVLSYFVQNFFTFKIKS